jgi:hypothetical protein
MANKQVEVQKFHASACREIISTEKVLIQDLTP